jgi:hypothetical protein
MLLLDKIEVLSMGGTFINIYPPSPYKPSMSLKTITSQSIECSPTVALPITCSSPTMETVADLVEPDSEGVRSPHKLEDCVKNPWRGAEEEANKVCFAN